MTFAGASPQGTERYAARCVAAGVAAPEHFRALPDPPRGNLRASSFGLGSYTGPTTEAADEEYATAVAAAVRGGVNVIDCAINYRHQRSERALGRGLARLFASGDAARDEVVVMTKGGYVPFDGEVPRDPDAYIRETYLEPGILAQGDLVDGCHAIAPSYLSDQLSRSLRNFGLGAVDVYFLHNVEAQLAGVDRETFRERVRAAFGQLEREVAAGRIGRYGVATWNGFLRATNDREHLSLEELLELAREAAGGEHHFQVVQLPFNPAMPGAAQSETQIWRGEPISLVAAAREAGLFVVTSVPLLQTQVLSRLPAEWERRFAPLRTRAQWAIQFARSTPGIGAPLVGMRQAQHVKENLAVARVAPMC